MSPSTPGCVANFLRDKDDRVVLAHVDALVERNHDTEKPSALVDEHSFIAAERERAIGEAGFFDAGYELDAGFALGNVVRSFSREFPQRW